MSFAYIFLLYAVLIKDFCFGQTWNEIQRDLAREEKNFRCCAQKLSCCNRPPEPTNFEVRALFTKCLPYHGNHTSTCDGSFKKRNTKGGKYARSVNEGYQILNCKKKIKLTIKITNSGMTNCKSQYILIDHVFDSVSGQKQKLLYPYALKIKQQPIKQIYILNFDSIVNAHAKEKVYSKQDAGE